MWHFHPSSPVVCSCYIFESSVPKLLMPFALKPFGVGGDNYGSKNNL